VLCDHGAVFEIGNSLLEARSRRGVDFVQAELATKIRVKYLRALEEERFEQLPSQTYVKGFLRTYADYLGLDGQLYVDEYNSRFVVGDELDSRPRRSTVRPERRTRRLETGIVLVALAAMAVVTLVLVSAWQTSGSGAKTPAAHARSHRVKKHTGSRLSAYLQINAVKGPSYVLVHRGGPSGKQLFQGTIGKGRVVPFSGRRFWVSLSSPENLIVIVGGKAVPLAGGKPVVLTITPSGVRTA
jgi:cytoskeleton protein RodZ